MIGLPLVLHMLLCGSTAVGNSTLHFDQQDILNYARAADLSSAVCLKPTGA